MWDLLEKSLMENFIFCSVERIPNRTRSKLPVSMFKTITSWLICLEVTMVSICTFLTTEKKLRKIVSFNLNPSSFFPWYYITILVEFLWINIFRFFKNNCKFQNITSLNRTWWLASISTKERPGTTRSHLKLPKMTWILSETSWNHLKLHIT